MYFVMNSSLQHTKRHKLHRHHRKLNKRIRFDLHGDSAVIVQVDLVENLVYDFVAHFIVHDLLQVQRTGQPLAFLASRASAQLKAANNTAARRMPSALLTLT